MNDKSNTFLYSGKGTFSALDLSICHPSLYLDYEWSVCEDQHGSDHFPIVIESIKTSEEDHNPKWKLNKANWDLFHTLCDESLTTTSLSDSTDCIADFTSSLIDISEKCIPKPRLILRKVTRGIMTTVKKLSNKEKTLCLGSANFQLKII